MTVHRFPDPAPIKPVVEVFGLSGNGPFDVYVWRNADREEGYHLTVPDRAGVRDVLRIVAETRGGKHG
jgi:hypothetical protein